MANATIKRLSPGYYRLDGDVVISGVMQVLEEGEAIFAEEPGSDITVSLAGLRRTDSAALGLLVVWLRWCQAHGKGLHLSQIPESLDALARICEVETLLPVAEDQPGLPLH